jgi:hypothetical protein
VREDDDRGRASLRREILFDEIELFGTKLSVDLEVEEVKEASTLVPAMRCRSRDKEGARRISAPSTLRSTHRPQSNNGLAFAKPWGSESVLALSCWMSLALP